MTKDARTQREVSVGGVFVPLLFLILVCVVQIRSPLRAATSRDPIVEIDGWFAGSPLPQAVVSRNAILHNNHVLVLGGRDRTNGSLQAIYSAPITSDGSLGTWSANSQLPLPLYLHSVAVYGQYIYVIGGWNANVPREMAPNDAVWRGVLTNDGRITDWIKVGTYPTEVTLHKSVVVGRRLYSLGGYANVERTPLANVYYTDIDPTTGSIGPWQSGPELPVAVRRFGFATAQISGTTYFYVTGGTGEEGSSTFDTVYYSAVDTNGSLSDWQSGPNLPQARRYHASVIHDGRLLVIGGADNQSEYNTVWASSLAADGRPGAWRALTALPQTRYRFAAISVERFDSNYVFAIGGYTGSAAQSSVVYSTVPSAPTPESTPTPAATATPTQIPTPTAGLVVEVSHEPAGWIGPGEQIEYKIQYSAQNAALTDVRIESPLPDVRAESTLPSEMELVAGSVTSTDNVPFTQTEEVIGWVIGDLDISETGELSYRVMRPVPPPPESSPATVLEIALEGPSRAEAGVPFEYTLVVTNRSVVPLTDVTVYNTVPLGATYVIGANGPPVNGEVTWNLPVLPALGTNTFSYTIVTQQSVLNNLYRVENVREDGREGANALGYEYVWTEIPGTRPLVGDNFVVVHPGVRASWRANGSDVRTQSTPLTNPMFTTYLPFSLSPN